MGKRPGTKLDPIVHTNCGIVEGAWMQTPGKSDIANFLGIPFAQPPVGERRWRAPETTTPWSGIRQAKCFIRACSQLVPEVDIFSNVIAETFDITPPKPPPLDYSEDCLYLNVFTESLDQSAKKPVMVWIHGGAFISGTSAHTNPQNLVRKGVVVVTINYRLGVLGFLSHPELSAESPHGVSGNYGLLDQIEALKWVKHNIINFGGDPDNVTIFGVSAGGTSVSLFMVSPLTAGLFHRAISQSGVGLNMYLHLKRPGFFPVSAESLGEYLAKSLGANNLSSLRNASADTLIKTALNLPGVNTPIIDGYVLNSRPTLSFSQGRVHLVPFILGSTADEGSLLYYGSPMIEIPPPVSSPEQYTQALRPVFEADTDRVLALYPANNNEEMLASSKELLGDSLMGAQAHYVARQMAFSGHPPYLYFFSRKPAGKAGKILGAFHGADANYIFGENILGILTAEDRKMSEIMMDYWVQFARTGNPNGPGRPEWIPFEEKYMEFDQEAAMKPISKIKKYELIEAFYDRHKMD